MRRRLLWGLVAILLSFAAVAWLAQTIFQSAVSPGELTRHHAKLQNSCSSCHLAFAPWAENRLCSSCHQRVAEDRAQRTGFHGRSSSARGQDCRSCHTEHKGRAAPLVMLDQSKFNHLQTDFPLKGSHAIIKCKACHLPERKFAMAPTQCVACHAKADVHKGGFGQKCSTCHVETSWKSIAHFDHARTGYPLVGAHFTASCRGCHSQGRLRGTPKNCIACHAADDKHMGARGANCASCHSPKGWGIVDFFHDRDTRFSLTGGHKRVSCAACHGTAMSVKKPSTQCVDCHKKQDVHKGSNGKNCVQCHNVASWRGARFDHAKLTRFPLRGAHALLTCNACHGRALPRNKPGMACATCHKKDDPHRGNLGGNCQSCHGETSWKEQVRFDHTLTGFPLLGRHALLRCTSCHTDKSFSVKGQQCASCHADDYHKGRLGRSLDCATCHVPSGWMQARFDHGRKTGFAIDGKHAALGCHSCHVKPAASANLGSSCYSCHRADDTHRGAFGRNCAACHSTQSFRPARVPQLRTSLPQDPLAMQILQQPGRNSK